MNLSDKSISPASDPSTRRDEGGETGLAALPLRCAERLRLSENASLRNTCWQGAALPASVGWGWAGKAKPFRTTERQSRKTSFSDFVATGAGIRSRRNALVTQIHQRNDSTDESERPNPSGVRYADAFACVAGYGFFSCLSPSAAEPSLASGLRLCRSCGLEIRFRQKRGAYQP